MKTLTLFNNKGGVGTTSVVYHLAWMYADLGLRILVADLDPQANLTRMFLAEERLEELWSDGAVREPVTIYRAIRPLLDGIGDVAAPHVEDVAPGISLIAGDLDLARAEDDLSSQWPLCQDGQARAFRVVSALWRVLRAAAVVQESDLVLVDVGPNLGALNRAALVACEHVVVPMTPDLYSIKGLENLGPALRRWRQEWRDRRGRVPADLEREGLSLPEGRMHPSGYVVLQHAVRLDRPVQTYQRWMDRIPTVYQEAVLDEHGPAPGSIQDDPHCLGRLKHYRSLMPLAQEARKPMFFLRPADGALGGHLAAVQACYRDFRELARRVAASGGLALP